MDIARVFAEPFATAWPLQLSKGHGYYLTVMTMKLSGRSATSQNGLFRCHYRNESNIRSDVVKVMFARQSVVITGYVLFRSKR